MLLKTISWGQHLFENIEKKVNERFEKRFEVGNEIFKIERADFSNFGIRFAIRSTDTIITVFLSYESQVVNIKPKLLQIINL